jgi:hypothetical protein
VTVEGKRLEKFDHLKQLFVESSTGSFQIAREIPPFHSVSKGILEFINERKYELRCAACNGRTKHEKSCRRYITSASSKSIQGCFSANAAASKVVGLSDPISSTGQDDDNDEEEAELPVDVEDTRSVHDTVKIASLEGPTVKLDIAANKGVVTNEEKDEIDPDGSDDSDDDEDVEDPLTEQCMCYFEQIFNEQMKAHMPEMDTAGNFKRPVSIILERGSSLYEVVFPYPEIRSHYDDGYRKKWGLSGIAHALAGLKMVLIDPFITHNLMKFIFMCKAKVGNSSCGQALNRHNRRFVIQRGTESRVLVVQTYRCRGCLAADKPGGSRYISCTSDEFLSMMPESVRASYEFLSIGTRVYNSSLGPLVINLKRCHASFHGITSAINLATKERLLKRDLLRAQMLIDFRGSLRRFNTGVTPPHCADFLKLFKVSDRATKKLFHIVVSQGEGYVQSTMRNNASTTNAIAIDHTFPNGNKGTSIGSVGFLVALDAIGRPIFAGSVVNKSLKGAGITFRLKKINALSAEKNGTSKIAVVYTDNTGGDKNTLSETLPQANSVLDCFHLLEDVYTAVRRGSSNFCTWVEMVTSVVYVFCKEDVETKKAELLKQKKDHPEFLLNNSLFLKKQPDIRRSLGSLDEITSGIKKAVALCLGMSLFTKEVTPIVERFLNRLPDALNYPSGFCDIVKIERNGKVIYRHLRGTNFVENINKEIKAARLNRYPPSVVHDIMILILWDRSETMDENILGLNHCGLFNFTLRNDLLVAQERLQWLDANRHQHSTKAHLRSDFKLIDECDRTATVPREDFLSSFDVPLNSSVLKHNQAGVPTYPEDLLRSNGIAEFKTPGETAFAKLIIRDSLEEVVKPTFQGCLDEEGLLKEQFFLDAKTEGFDTVVNIERLVDIWNDLMKDAYEMNKDEVTILNVRIKMKFLSFKEPLHVRNWLDRQAGKVQAKHLPSEAKEILKPQTMSDFGSRTKDLTLAASTTPSVAATPAAAPPVLQVGPLTDSANLLEGNRPCDVCKLKKHKTEEQKKCKYYVFSQGVFPRKSSQSRQEAIREAWEIHQIKAHMAESD